MATIASEQVSIAFALADAKSFTNLEIQIDNTGWFSRSPASTTSPLVINRLTNGRTYQVRLRAVGPAGRGQVSQPVSFTPATTPSVPTDFSVTPGDRQASITFRPGLDGGSPITNYEVSLDNGTTWSARSPASAALPIVLTNLVNGRTYPVKVRAVNAIGAGWAPQSPTLVAAIAPGTPGPPTALSGGAVDGVATIAFTPPASSGGSAITRYECSIDNGITWKDPRTTNPAGQVTCGGMSNGFGYALRLRAVNAVGPGTPSATLLLDSVSTPDKPTIFPTAGDRQATVSFNPIRWDGGRPITNIEYSLDNGPWVTRSPSSPSSPVTISGLVNGRTYQVRLRAVNVIGPGIPSEPKSVTPISPAAPGPVRVLSITPGNRQATVAFNLPTSTGGSPITNLEYSVDFGVTWVARSPAGTRSPLVITGLTNGVRYLVRLRAVNAAGPGLPEAGALPVTPRTR